MKRFKQYIKEKELYGTKEFNDVISFSKNIEKKYGIELDLYLSNSGVLVLSRIFVPKDKRFIGIGTKTMKEIFNFADEKKLDIYLTPSSDFGGNKEKLKKWYKSLGFQKNKISKFSETMVRYHV